MMQGNRAKRGPRARRAKRGRRGPKGDATQRAGAVDGPKGPDTAARDGHRASMGGTAAGPENGRKGAGPGPMTGGTYEGRGQARDDTRKARATERGPGGKTFPKAPALTCRNALKISTLHLFTLANFPP